ncbi:MAG: response regulator [Chloroflexi bacterium]|nr:response regulator [Chloroflexota bacterium]
MRVLIADDEAMIRMGLRAMLSEAGHEVVGAAADGSAALTLAHQLLPDIIILDIKMPQLDGLETARRIMAEQPTPIVMLTAFSQRDLIEQAKAAAVFAYLVKPVKEELLAPTLELARARFEEWQQLRQEVADLQESLETRDLVERAKRVVMQRDGLSEREAFLSIHHRSRERRVPMRMIAEEILKLKAG